MNKFLSKAFSIILFVIVFCTFPIRSYAVNYSSLSNYFIATQQKSVINYEKSQPSAIDNPVVDPNFNVMRTTELNSSSATYIVVALLVIASIVPLATWYISKSKTN